LETIDELYSDQGIDEIRDWGRSIPEALADLNVADCYWIKAGLLVREKGSGTAELARCEKAFFSEYAAD
jgi:hypothetical protein